jgi:GntR family transcriptional regulator, transcriptional repressor for pyruvate dehydrogenase complex
LSDVQRISVDESRTFEFAGSSSVARNCRSHVMVMPAAIQETSQISKKTAAEPPASGQYLKPLARATLPQEIVSAIAELIIKRVWKPGDRIPPEKELATRFAVGRSTIREAIKSLVIFGVIDARPGDGSYIREATSDLLSGGFRWGSLLTEQNLGDLVDMRVLIEVECAGRAAASVDPALAANLLHLVDRMGEEKNNPELFMKLDNQFHIAIAAASHNALYLSLSTTIQSLVGVWYSQTFEIEPTKSATLKEHLAIAKAIEVRDENAARLAMRQHLLRAAKRLQKAVNTSK